MKFSLTTLFGAGTMLLPVAQAHISIWHPSMWGFNVTDKTPFNNFGNPSDTDNRPVAPLVDFVFQRWWFHGHLDHPPNKGDFFELPAGGVATTELACNKGATTWFNSSEGGDIRNPDKPNDPCPGAGPDEYHTKGPDDLFGCSLAITYKSDVDQVQPEDFTVFSVNHTCVWNRFTDFPVPAGMPPCPEEGCICAWFWIHSPDSGGEQNYMNGFRCKVTNSTSNVPLAKPQIARRCGADPEFNKHEASLGNCTYGAKQPFYWFQKERNNMNEGTYAPPRYLDMYNFKDGAQDDIFENSYPDGIPSPSPNQTLIPTPLLYTPGSVPISTAPPASSSPASQTASSATPSSSSLSTTLSGSSTHLSSSSPSASGSPSHAPSSSPPTTASASPSVSVVVSTVVSTAIVTQTVHVPPPVPTTSMTTSIATQVVQVTVTDGPNSAASSAVSSLKNIVTAVVTVTASAPAEAVPTGEVRLVNDTATTLSDNFDVMPPTMLLANETETAKSCKRHNASGLQRRSSLFLSGYRKNKKRSFSLWHPF